MKNFMPTCFVAALLCFFSTKIVAQQPDVVILGPAELDNCFQICGTYQASIVNMTPPFTYSWTGPNGFTSAQQPLIYCITNTPVSGGGTIVLTLTVTDAAGITASDEIPIIIKNNILPVNGTVTPACDNCDGTISILNSPTGTCNEYIWGNGQIGPNIVGLCPGLYSVTVTNCQSNCTSLGSFYVPAGTGGARLISDNPNPCNHPDSLGNLIDCEKVCAGQTVQYPRFFPRPTQRRASRGRFRGQFRTKLTQMGSP
jgi:hypothetical protein